jgi:predicted membrane protein
LVFGIVLLAIGIVWLLASLDVIDVHAGVILPSALIGVGVALVALSRSRGRGGLIALGVILTVVLTITTAFDIRLEGGVGDRTVTPTSLADIRDGIHLAAGQLTVDLTALTFPEGTTPVEITLGTGHLVVRVPPLPLHVVVHGTAGAGQVVLFGREHNGVQVDVTAVRPGAGPIDRTLLLRVAVGLGQITVEESPGSAGTSEPGGGG